MVSSKYLNVYCINKLRKVDKRHEKGRFLFLTAFGYVSGSILEPRTDESVDGDTEDVVKDAFIRGINLVELLPFLKREAMSSPDFDRVLGDGAFFMLRDAKIFKDLNGCPALSLGLFILHAEDIIGFTLAPEDFQ